MSKKNGRWSASPRSCVLELTGDFAGAEARCRLDVGMGAYLAFQRLVESQEPNLVEEACQRFGDEVLEEWNIDLDGQPLPATAEGFLRMPTALALAMIQAWGEAMTGTPAPLGEGSPSSQGDSPEPTTTKAEVS